MYMDLRLATLKQSLSICCTMFQHRINAESFPVSHLCVNTLPASWQSVYTQMLSTCILYGCLQRVMIPEAVVIQLVLLRMGKVLLETC